MDQIRKNPPRPTQDVQSFDEMVVTKKGSTDRPNRIKFIKEVQKEIKVIKDRRKVMSLIRCDNIKAKSTFNKENEESLKHEEKTLKEPLIV